MNALKLEFAGSVLSNYRYSFRVKHGRDWPGTDQQLLDLINEIGVMSTSQEQDEATLEEMEDFKCD